MTGRRQGAHHAFVLALLLGCVALGAAGPLRRLKRGLLQAPGTEPCARSWLGYQCTQLVCGRIRVHWSLGGQPPTGPGCSYLSTVDPLNSSQVASPDASSELLHLVLQTDVTGYVAVSWPKTPGVMAPADSIVGYQAGDGNTSIRAYSISGWTPDSVQPDMNMDVLNSGMEVNGTALTICFTRNISQVGQRAGVMITPADPIWMNFVASSAPFKQRHLLGNNYKCKASLSLLRAVGGPDDGGWRPSNSTGSGSEDDVMEERLGYMRAHGALQFTGWIVLVPGGVLAARHRWLFTRFGVMGMWFQVHRAVQMVAATLILIGFVLPWTTFDSDDAQAAQGIDHEAEMESNPLLESHERLAITLMVVLGLHVVLAIVRPKPEASWRWAWNMLHWWTGRALALLAAVNVCIGIGLWRGVSGGSGAEWVVPLVLFGLGWLALAGWLERQAPVGHGREGGSGLGPPLTAGYSTSTGPPAGEVPMSHMVPGGTANGVPYNKL